MKKSLVVLIAVLMVLVGCSTEKKVEQKDILIKHDLGEVMVKSNPQKVVIFDLGVLDIFKEFVLPVSALPKSNLSKNLENYNDEKYLNAGTLFEPLFEELAEHQPDLIIISGRAATNYDELSKIAPTIALNMDNKDFSGSLVKRLDTIASLYPDKADKINTEKTALLSSIEALKEKTATLKGQTLFILTNGDTISAYGAGSRFGMVYDEFGFTPVDDVIDEDSKHGQQISFEFFVKHNPETIIVMDRVIAIASDDKVGQDLLNNDLVNKTDAAINNRIFYVDPFVWYLEVGGLNATKTMIKEMNELVK